MVAFNEKPSAELSSEQRLSRLEAVVPEHAAATAKWMEKLSVDLARIASSMQSSLQDGLKLRRLEIVDDAGRPMVVLHANGGRGGLALCNQSGAIVGHMTEADDGDAVIGLNAADGEPRVAIIAGVAGSLELCNAAGAIHTFGPGLETEGTT